MKCRHRAATVMEEKEGNAESGIRLIRGQAVCQILH